MHLSFESCLVRQPLSAFGFDRVFFQKCRPTSFKKGEGKGCVVVGVQPQRRLNWMATYSSYYLLCGCGICLAASRVFERREEMCGHGPGRHHAKKALIESRFVYKWIPPHAKSGLERTEGRLSLIYHQY